MSHEPCACFTDVETIRCITGVTSDTYTIRRPTLVRSPNKSQVVLATTCAKRKLHASLNCSQEILSLLGSFLLRLLGLRLLGLRLLGLRMWPGPEGAGSVFTSSELSAV